LTRKPHRKLDRDISDNQKRLAGGTNRDDRALAIGRRNLYRSPPAVSPRLTRYTPAQLGFGDHYALATKLQFRK